MIVKYFLTGKGNWDQRHTASLQDRLGTCATVLRDMGQATGKMTELCTVAKLNLVCTEKGSLGLAKGPGKV